MCACRCVYMCVYVLCVVFLVLSGPDRWSTKLKKRNVRRNPGGVAILTCESFVMLGERGDRQTEPSHSCQHTRRRFECTPGGVLNPHTEFSACHTTHTTHTTPHIHIHIHSHSHTQTTTTTTTTTARHNDTNQPTHTTKAQQHAATTQQQHRGEEKREGRKDQET